MSTPRRIINLTPHVITIAHADGSATTLASEGVARLLSEQQTELEPAHVNGRRVRVTTPQVFKGLEAPVVDAASTSGIIVSAFVGEYLVRTGTDLGVRIFSPGELVRDAKGDPTGTRGLVEYRLP